MKDEKLRIEELQRHIKIACLDCGLSNAYRDKVLQIAANVSKTSFMTHVETLEYVYVKIMSGDPPPVLGSIK